MNYHGRGLSPPFSHYQHSETPRQPFMSSARPSFGSPSASLPARGPTNSTYSSATTVGAYEVIVLSDSEDDGPAVQQRLGRYDQRSNQHARNVVDLTAESDPFGSWRQRSRLGQTRPQLSPPTQYGRTPQVPSPASPSAMSASRDYGRRWNHHETLRTLNRPNTSLEQRQAHPLERRVNRHLQQRPKTPLEQRQHASQRQHRDTPGQQRQPSALNVLAAPEHPGPPSTGTPPDRLQSQLRMIHESLLAQAERGRLASPASVNKPSASGTTALTSGRRTRNVYDETNHTRSPSPRNRTETSIRPTCTSCLRNNVTCDGRSPSCRNIPRSCDSQFPSPSSPHHTHYQPLLSAPSSSEASILKLDESSAQSDENSAPSDQRAQCSSLSSPHYPRYQPLLSAPSSSEASILKLDESSAQSDENSAPSDQRAMFDGSGAKGISEPDDANTNTEQSVDDSGQRVFRSLKSFNRGKIAPVDFQIQKAARVDAHAHDAPDSETTADEREPQLDDESDASESSLNSVHPVDIEPEIESVRMLANILHEQLCAFQERAVQADLRQATVDMRKSSGPQLDLALPDPFKGITELRHANANILPPLSDKAHERPQNKKLMIIRAQEEYFSTGGPGLPKYKAIGRVATSFLAPNYRTAKYRPYDAEDEIQDPEATQKYAELEQRFNNNYEALVAQRSCQELIWLWKPWAEEFLASLQLQNSDVLYFFTQDHFEPDRILHYEWSAASQRAWREEQMRRCRTCELADPEGRRIHFSETFNNLPVPNDRNLAFAGLAAHVFHEVAKFSLWHIVLGGLLKPRYEDSHAVTQESSGLCVICYRYQCPDHGSYEEPRDDDNGLKDSEDLKAFINDEEKDHNLRKFMSLPPHKREAEPAHICGVFCVDPSLPLQQIIGQQVDLSIAGECRPSPQKRYILSDNDLCGPSCFWAVANRRNIKIADVKFQPFLSQSQKILVEKLMQFYLHNKRGPCLISRIVKDVSCLMVFHHMIFQIFKRPHPTAESDADLDSASNGQVNGGMRKKKKPPMIMDVSMSAELDERPPFFPCSHEGPCHNNPACTCAKSKVHCEQFCGCDETCKRRFRGCTCTTRGNKICFKDNRCECWKLNRECDPYLCGKCGVVDILDSSNKYRDDVRRGRCRNNRLQLALPAATTKAPSQVQGYGLYSREDIQSGDFIGEYTGEVISISEGDRRGAMYHVLNQEYLFVINKGQEIDASNNGNKMRFMNNSQREENINVEPKKLFCSGLVRVGLFARRNIVAGEELLYNYNYPPSVVKNFWEPGERPTNTRGLIPLLSERVARTTGANLLTEENGSEDREDNSQSPLISRHPKRKRPLVESPASSSLAGDPDVDKMDSEEDLGKSLKPPVVDDSDDLDYVTNGHGGSDDGEEDADLEVEDESDLEPRGQELGRRRTAGVRAVRASRSRDASGAGARTSRSRGGSSSSARERPLRAEGRLRQTDRNSMKAGKDKRYGGKAQQQAWQTRRMNDTQSQGNSSSDM